MSIIVSSSLSASVAYKYNNDDYELTEHELNGMRYVKLSKALAPVKVKPVYNRVLHKISFRFNDNVFIMSPISNAVSVNGKIEMLNKPVLINKNGIYLSKRAFVFIAPELSCLIVKPVVIVDAGHGGGGEDGRGAEAELGDKKIMEKEITLKFSNMLGDVLRKEGYDVEYTRTDDRKIDLKKRAEIANGKKGRIFVSIHANSSIDRNAKGVDIFYMSEEAEDAYSGNVAKVESGDKDVAVIIKSMSVSGHIKDSARLAMDISSSLQKDMINRGVKKAPFAVLSGTAMPSVLLELGFMTNADDLERLTRDDDLKALALKVGEGIDVFLNTYKGS